LVIGRQEDPASAGFFFAAKCRESSIIIDVRFWPLAACQNLVFLIIRTTAFGKSGH